MRKRPNEEKDLEPGESLHFRNTNNYMSPHCHALYLGQDCEGDKVLLPTFIDGFAIVLLDSIDEGAYRGSGKFNIREEIYDKKNPISFSYVFFDTIERQVEEKVVTVKKINDCWKIIEFPPPPSWRVRSRNEVTGY